MRTKTLLLSAVALAAGLLSSQAQSNVYSVNVVGYANITLQPGYNLISCPLLNSNNDVNTVLAVTTPTIDDNSGLFTWDNAGQSFNQSDVSAGGQWYLAD